MYYIINNQLNPMKTFTLSLEHRVCLAEIPTRPLQLILLLLCMLCTYNASILKFHPTICIHIMHMWTNDFAIIRYNVVTMTMTKRGPKSNNACRTLR